MPATLFDFTRVNDAAAATTKKLQKQSILAAYLRSIDSDDDLRLAVRYTSGRTFASTDERVLGAMAAIPRHLFVDEGIASRAYEDVALPIGHGQTISSPTIVGIMTQLLLEKSPMDKVLEIGTGCGYQAAVLSCVAAEVYSVERLRGLHEKARENLRPLRLPNVHLLFGDGMVGFAKGAPYAGIIAAAGGEAIPQAWIDQLAVGARIVAPMVLQGGRQALTVVEKTSGQVKQSVLETVHFVPLKSGIA